MGERLAVRTRWSLSWARLHPPDAAAPVDHRFAVTPERQIDTVQPLNLVANVAY